MRGIRSGGRRFHYRRARPSGFRADTPHPALRATFSLKGRRKALLPDPIPEEGPVDLYAHYDRTRRLTFGALILGLMAFRVVGRVRWAGGAFPEAGPMTVWRVLKSVPWAFRLGYGVLIVVWQRWVNVTLLAAGLVYDGRSVLPMRLGE